MTEGLFTDLTGAMVKVTGGFYSVDCEELYIVESVIFDLDDKGYCTPYLYLKDLDIPINIEDVQIYDKKL